VQQLEERRGVKPSEIDAVLFSHAHWSVAVFMQLTTGIIVDPSPRSFPMQKDTLGQEPSPTVHQGTRQILNHDGTDIYSTQSTELKTSWNMKELGQDLDPLRKRLIFLETSHYG
jgi:hypothetical protein